MRLSLVAVMAVSTLLAAASTATAQIAGDASWTDLQNKEFQRWLKEETEWREWMGEHRNVTDHNWMGQDGRNWRGQASGRKKRPVAPGWLSAVCDAIHADELAEHPACERYEQLKNYDLVAETIREQIAQSRTEKVEHTHFGLKRHWGFGLGYDNTRMHGSVGMQMTIAEWGRWNYGTLGASLGFVKRHLIDDRTQQEYSKNDLSLFITIASASYRIKYLSSFGMYWYVDVAQLYDMTHSMPISQFGFSLAKK